VMLESHILMFLATFFTHTFFTSQYSYWAHL